jgi:hypothetical protein
MKYLLSILAVSFLFIACDSQTQTSHGDSDTTRYNVVFGRWCQPFLVGSAHYLKWGKKALIWLGGI